MKAVLDSSVLVSAFLNPRGLPGRVLGAGLDGRYIAVLSERILAETLRVLTTKPNIARRFRSDGIEARRFVGDLAATQIVVTALVEIAPVCRDPDDNHVLAAATTSGGVAHRHR